MSNVKAMQQAILEENTVTAKECMEVVLEVLKDYNCKLDAVPMLVEISPGVFATTHSWRIAVLDN